MAFRRTAASILSINLRTRLERLGELFVRIGKILQFSLQKGIVGSQVEQTVAGIEKDHRLIGFGLLGDLDGGLDGMFRTLGATTPGLIRVDADETTYNLHIILRFELELALSRGDLAVDDLPGAWNETCRRLLGLTPPNDTVGVLQDVHWATGEFGYFPTYALGNIYAAELFAAAGRARPDLDTAMATAPGTRAQNRAAERCRVPNAVRRTGPIGRGSEDSGSRATHSGSRSSSRAHSSTRKPSTDKAASSTTAPSTDEACAVMRVAVSHCST